MNDLRELLRRRQAETALRASEQAQKQPEPEIFKGEWLGRDSATGDGLVRIPGRGIARGKIRTNAAMPSHVRMDLHNNSIDAKPAPPYPAPQPGTKPKEIEPEAAIAFLLEFVGEGGTPTPCACLIEKLTNRVYFLLVQEYVRTVEEGPIPCRSPIWVKIEGGFVVRRSGYYESDRSLDSGYGVAEGEAYPAPSEQVPRKYCQKFCTNDLTGIGDVVDPDLTGGKPFYRTLAECLASEDNPEDPGGGTPSPPPPPPGEPPSPDNPAPRLIAIAGNLWIEGVYPRGENWSVVIDEGVPRQEYYQFGDLRVLWHITENTIRYWSLDFLERNNLGEPNDSNYAYSITLSKEEGRILLGTGAYSTASSSYCYTFLVTENFYDRYGGSSAEYLFFSGAPYEIERENLWKFAPPRWDVIDPSGLPAQGRGYLTLSRTRGGEGIQLTCNADELPPPPDLDDPDNMPPPPPPDPNPDVPKIVEAANTRRSLKFWVAGHQSEPELVTEMCREEYPIMGITTDSSGNWVVVEKSGANYPDGNNQYENLFNSGARADADNAFTGKESLRVLRHNYIRTYPRQKSDHPLYIFSQDNFYYGKEVGKDIVFGVGTDLSEVIPVRPGAPVRAGSTSQNPPLSLYDGEMSIYRNTSYIERMCFTSDWSVEGQLFVSEESGLTKRFVSSPAAYFSGSNVTHSIDFFGVNLQKFSINTEESGSQEVKLISYLGHFNTSRVADSISDLVKIPQEPFLNAPLVGIIQSKDFALMNEPITGEIEYIWAFKDTASPIGFRIKSPNNTEHYGLYYGSLGANNYISAYRPASPPHFGVRRRVTVPIYRLGKPEWFDDPQYNRLTHLNAYIPSEAYWELGKSYQQPTGTNISGTFQKLPFKIVAHTTFVAIESTAEAELEWENYLAEQEG